MAISAGTTGRTTGAATAALVVGVVAAMLVAVAIGLAALALRSTAAPEAGAPGATAAAPSSSPTRLVLEVGAAQLGEPLALPLGVRLAGPATTGEDPGDYHRWQVALDLADVPPAVVLDSLAQQLRDAGFDVQRYDDEVLGARSTGGRTQLVVAHVPTSGTEPRIVLAIGSRPA